MSEKRWFTSVGSPLVPHSIRVRVTSAAAPWAAADALAARRHSAATLVRARIVRLLWFAGSKFTAEAKPRLLRERFLRAAPRGIWDAPRIMRAASTTLRFAVVIVKT